MRLIIDAHLDLAWNAVSFDRDQLSTIERLRAAEAHMSGTSRGNCTVCLPEMRQGGVAVCLATVLSRAFPSAERLTQLSKDALRHSPIGARQRGETILRENLDYANQTIASAAGQAQLAYYQLLERQGHIRMIRNAAQLDDLWSMWEDDRKRQSAPIGFILSMEGTDPIVDPDHAPWWWEQGLRTACLAHYGPSAYAMGTGGDGPITPKGRDLLKVFDDLGMVLDLVHTADTAFSQALEVFDGPVFISHGNARALVPHDRQISDEQIRAIAQKEGLIGVVFDCWMLKSNWHDNGTTHSDVSLETVADHIDHICQVVGNSSHVGFGSDLDGGFGKEQSPCDLDTIADLQKLEPILASRGYRDDDIDAIFHRNWLEYWRNVLPE